MNGTQIILLMLAMLELGFVMGYIVAKKRLDRLAGVMVIAVGVIAVLVMIA